MSDEIKVGITKGSNGIYYARYSDPRSGKRVARSTRTKKRRDAERFAAKWEAQLKAGTYGKTIKVSWEEFRERYEAEVLTGLALSTGVRVRSVFAHVERILKPKRLVEVDSKRISLLLATLRSETITVTQKDGTTKTETKTRSESTLKSTAPHLKAGLRWAESVELLHEAPTVKMPKRTGGTAKGRAIVLEEFERMLAKVPSVVGEEAAPSWEHYLRGLWLSGLRLQESLSLSWDDDSLIRVDLDGDCPMLRIPAELQKSHKSQLLPITEDFEELLRETPEEERTGYVFDPRPKREHGKRLRHYRVSELGRLIGEAANIVVSTGEGGKVKCASLHDLRRSFATRWAARVPVHVLKAMMRHESITTTMEFYVTSDAESLGAIIRSGAKNGTALARPERDKSEKPVKQHAREDSNLRPTD